MVQVGDATRPLAGGEYFDRRGTKAVVEHLRAEYGERFQTAITAGSVEDELRELMQEAGIDANGESTIHFGEEKSRNDFGGEDVGVCERIDRSRRRLCREPSSGARPRRDPETTTPRTARSTRRTAGAGGSRGRTPTPQRFEPPNSQLISAGIATINDMETLRACVAYENTHQQRVQILRRLDDRASELRSEDTEGTLAGCLSAPSRVEARNR